MVTAARGECDAAIQNTNDPDPVELIRWYIKVLWHYVKCYMIPHDIAAHETPTQQPHFIGHFRG